MVRKNTFSLSGWFLSRPREMKRLLTLVTDYVSAIFSLWLAFSLRLDIFYVPPQEQIWIFLLAPAILIPIFIRFGLYRSIIRYLGLKALWTVLKAVSLYILVFSVIVLLAGEYSGLVPRTVYGLNGLIILIIAGGTRLVARWWFTDYHTMSNVTSRKSKQSQPVLIYGAGASGAQIASLLGTGHELNPVGFIDDEPALHNQHVNGLRIYPFSRLNYLIEKYEVGNILLAMPSISRQRRYQIISSLESYPLHVQTIPELTDIAQGRVKVADIQEVDIADLLGREQVAPIQSLLHANITDKAVLVTGAGGSIGSELCRQIIKLQPTMLVLYELNEFGLYVIEKELFQLREDIPIIAVLGSVQNQQRLEMICQRFNINTIYHAAAYKHVPLVEQNTTEGIRNNVFGTLNAAKAAIAAGVETFVLISTDKAVRPTNTMGATKRFAELILQALSEDDVQNPTTRFTMVRFGNVLGSSGSVVPLFREQIANGGPVTVTDSRIIRYFMTIPEAAELVIQAGAMGKGGDVFVLDMGKPVRILDMAKRMIHLSGFIEKDDEHPDGDIEIIYTGLRSGEKLYEELLIGENVTATEHSKVMRAQENIIPWATLNVILQKIEQANNTGDCQQVRDILTTHIDGFLPQCEVKDWLG
ncbi:MAG: polysaccharide biosynthesis protein [Gammaproteobacteria bacterium]|nr:polysaccharide biosynthesis protein [Gammaproteobacteria bacterium]